jgi:SAM-dependent methyltransferase
VQGDREREIFDQLARRHEDVRALDYSGARSQLLRFERMLRLDLHGKTMLDVGCGYGDMLQYLLERGVVLREYLGVEISPVIFGRIDPSRFHGTQATFRCADTFADPDIASRTFEVVLALGSLNYDHARLRERLGYLWDRVAPGGSLVFTQPSALAEPVQGTLANYADPASMLSFCFGLSRSVMLDHYLPHEFLVEVRRS